jgi:hypothetical protein
MQTIDPYMGYSKLSISTPILVNPVYDWKLHPNYDFFSQIVGFVA